MIRKITKKKKKKRINPAEKREAKISKNLIEKISIPTIYTLLIDFSKYFYVFFHFIEIGEKGSSQWMLASISYFQSIRSSMKCLIQLANQ